MGSDAKINVLYISYDGMLEPLGYSQVFQYLNEMAHNESFQFHLLSFEKSKDWGSFDRVKSLKNRLAEAGILWTPLRYHKSPTVPATLFDVFHGILRGLFIVIRYRIAIVHCRSYIASLIGLIVSRLSSAKFIFDMRGFWPDEKVDAGQWKKDSRVYRVIKKLERQFIKRADLIVSLTHAGVREMKKFPYLTGNENFVVIPTCANLEHFKLNRANSSSAEETRITMGYAGTTTGWYVFEPVLRLFQLLITVRPESQFLILNKGEHEEIRNALNRAGISEKFVTIKSASYDEMPQELGRMTFCTYFIKPTFSKQASAPTKLGELLGCGIPSLTNSGVGDVESILVKNHVGVALGSWDDNALVKGLHEMLKLIQDPSLPQRCRETSISHFSLRKGADDYLKLYKGLLRASPIHLCTEGEA